MFNNMNQFTRKESVRIRKYEEAFYFIDIDKCYQANELGAIIFKNIGTDLSFSELCNKICQKYNISDTSQVEDDTKKYIQFLLDEKIIIKCG